ncbi:MAG: hypothetical protein K8I82_21475, partial [Anaerolineae bacterium]|nr:hypothetical protein [Anaerolineae bacterium]
LDVTVLHNAMTAYMDVQHMTCPHCADWLGEGLLRQNGILIADIFWMQGIAVITYHPAYLSLDDLVRLVRTIGRDTCRHYSAEIIGHQGAIDALHLNTKAVS